MVRIVVALLFLGAAVTAFVTFRSCLQKYMGMRRRRRMFRELKKQGGTECCCNECGSSEE